MSQRCIGFAPLEDAYQEIMPRSFRIKSDKERRSMSLALLNTILPATCRFESKQAYRASLPSLFTEKVLSMIGCEMVRRPQGSNRIVRIYAKSSGYLSAALQALPHPRAQFLGQRGVHAGYDEALNATESYPLLDLVRVIFDGEEIALRAHLDTLFLNLVKERVAARQPNSTIEQKKHYLVVEKEGVRTVLLPRWKHLESGDVNAHREMIDEAMVLVRNEEHHQLYLIYPKNDRFTRHIPVRYPNAAPEENRRLKLIPYSFTFCIKKENRCRK